MPACACASAAINLPLVFTIFIPRNCLRNIIDKLTKSYRIIKYFIFEWLLYRMNRNGQGSDIALPTTQCSSKQCKGKILIVLTLVAFPLAGFILGLHYWLQRQNVQQHFCKQGFSIWRLTSTAWLCDIFNLSQQIRYTLEYCCCVKKLAETK